MPTTRAARRAAAERLLLDLPTDLLGLVLYQLPLAHDIAAVAPTCHTVCDAAKLAQKARPFSAEVVRFAVDTVSCNVSTVVAVQDLVITSSWCWGKNGIKVWREGVLVRTLPIHNGWIRKLALLPGGTRFVSVADDNTVKLCDLHGAIEHTIRLGSQFDNERRPWAVATLLDGVHFVVSLGNGEVRLYHVDDPDSCSLVYTFTGLCRRTVQALAVTHDGQHIISGGHDHLVEVWSVASKSKVCTFFGHTHHVMSIAVMPDNRRILSGGHDHTVRVWLINDGTSLSTFPKLHDQSVQALVALPDNLHALSGSDDNTIKLFNVNDGAVLRTFWQGAGVMCLALLPDGLRFVSGSRDNNARIAYHGLAPQK